MRTEGATFQAIADELSYAHASNVRRDLHEHMAEIPRPALEELRGILDDKLAKAESKAWPLTNNRDPIVKLRAIEVVARTVQRRADLAGIKPPVVSIQLPPVAPDVRSALARLSPVEVVILQHLQVVMASPERPCFEPIREEVVAWLNEHAPPVRGLLTQGSSVTSMPAREAVPVSVEEDDF